MLSVARYVSTTQLPPNQYVVRAATAPDADAIRALATENGMFDPDDMDGFDEMMGGYLSGMLDRQAWIVATYDTGIAGAAYYAPEPFADRLWNLYFLAVLPGGHRSGAGGELIRWVEQTLCQLGEEQARVLIVETSGTDPYAQARAFYAKHGFDEEARIREFYGPGDHKIVFWKALPTNRASNKATANR